MTMKNLAIFLLALVLGCPLFAAPPGLKFSKDIAPKVWETHAELFDAVKEVPDSLRSEASAVVLMALDYIEAKFDARPSMEYDKTYVRKLVFTRRMVKMLDQKAVDGYSEQYFGQFSKVKVLGFKFGEIKNGFGARILKPDGRVLDVDVDKAFALATGKKADAKKAVVHKLSIPGLEVGDIFDYFICDEEWMQDLDVKPVAIAISDTYPTMEEHFIGNFSPQLTVEYGALNGAPWLTQGTDGSGNNTVEATFYNLPMLHDRLYVNMSRVLPFYLFHIQNNNSLIRDYFASKRLEGVSPVVSSVMVFKDIQHRLNAMDDPRIKIGDTFTPALKRLVADFRKANPDAGKDAVLDATWRAARYLQLSGKEPLDKTELARRTSRFVRNQKLADSVGVAITCSRYMPELSNITHFMQPYFGLYADGHLYFESGPVTLPSETDADFIGELAGVYLMDNQASFQMPVEKRNSIPPSRNNRMTFDVRLETDSDYMISCRHEIVLSGSCKDELQSVITQLEWNMATEDYLAVPESRRADSGSYDEKEIKKKTEEKVSEFVYENICDEDVKVTDVEVLSRGLKPSEPDMAIRCRTRVPDLVREAGGEELLVPVGIFAGARRRLDGVERERQTDISLSCPMQVSYNITVPVPEGYVPDTSSLEYLSSNHVNVAGGFYSDAVVNDKGEVVVRVRKRFNRHDIPVSLWSEFLELHDAAASFSGSMIIFVKDNS